MWTRILLFAALAALACHRELPTAPGLPNDPTGPPAVAVLLGRTVDPNGAPVPNVMLSVKLSDRIMGPARSASDCSFRIEVIAPGNYTILLRVNGGPEQRGGLIKLLGGLNPGDVLVSACKAQYGTCATPPPNGPSPARK